LLNVFEILKSVVIITKNSISAVILVFGFIVFIDNKYYSMFIDEVYDVTLHDMSFNLSFG
jgi:hypothetical protein